MGVSAFVTMTRLHRFVPAALSHTMFMEACPVQTALASRGTAKGRGFRDLTCAFLAARFFVAPSSACCTSGGQSARSSCSASQCRVCFAAMQQRVWFRRAQMQCSSSSYIGASSSSRERGGVWGSAENQSFSGSGRPRGAFEPSKKVGGFAPPLFWTVQKLFGAAQTRKTANFQPNPKILSANLRPDPHHAIQLVVAFSLRHTPQKKEGSPPQTTRMVLVLAPPRRCPKYLAMVPLST